MNKPIKAERSLRKMYMTDLLIDRLPTGIEDKARKLLKETRLRTLTLATAESCTGGLLAALLTDIVGYSHVFERGFVVYSADAKSSLLGVSSALIAREGPVSKAVALAMVDGAIAHSTADLAVAITGYAGPGRADQETGLVHFACMRRDRVAQHREEHLGDRGRGAIRGAAVGIALDMLSQALR